jgi:hypothetical protein
LIIYYSAVPLNWEGLPDINVLHAFSNRVFRIDRPSWAKRLFIDSGGYVAWKQGRKIDIEKYHDFININADQIDAYAALDSIGDNDRSIELYDYSRSCGFNPIPVFHEMDSERTLNHYIDNSEYLGFAAINKGSRIKKKQFLDRCFSIAGNDCMAHGFGFMDTDILSTYPFYSVDGTYAFRLARFGMVITPWKTIKFNSESALNWDHHPFSSMVRAYIRGIGIDWNLLWSYDRDGLKERFNACIPFFESIGKSNDMQGELPF